MILAAPYLVCIIGALALVVTGFILATRHGHAPWKRAARGTLLISDAVRSAEASIAGMALVESRSDADIAEVKASAADYHGVEAKTEPLRRFLDFWQAVKWLDLTAEEK